MVIGRNTAPAKRFIDIEEALRWAYRDELPKRQHGGRFVPLATGSNITAAPTGADDEPFGRIGRPPGFPAASGDPHPDSLAIEAAVAGLGAWAGYEFSASDMSDLTCGIPLAASAMPIAIEAIGAMPGVVTVNARMGSRPHWSSEMPAPRWTTGPNGKPKVLIDETFVQVIDRRGRVFYELAYGPLPPGAIFHREPMPCPHTRKDLYREGAYCPLTWRPDPARLLAERAEHCAWHAGLEILADALSGQLLAIAVLSPAAAWAPWLNPSELHGRPPQLFAGLRHEPYRRCETREQAAAKRQQAARRARREAEEAPRVPRPVSKRGAGLG